MHERTLRTVLLIQGVEQSDPAGELLPLADRAEATRAAARDEAKLREALASPTLSSTTERFLAARAERLRERLELRSPIIHHVLALAGGASWVGRALAGGAFLFGLSLSALDGSRRINILAFPLIGLILWNLVVYVLLLVDRLRPRPVEGVRGSALSNFYERWVHWRADALLRSTARFNAPLTAALKRFATEWSAIAPSLLILRAKRLFHVCAALVAMGLITGIYVRGVGLQYQAGWESTFLGPSQVRLLLNAVYGPASVISGIGLPETEEEISALRWRTVENGGGAAARWIHLLALTALLYVILPRLFAAVMATVSLAWRSRRVSPPPSLIPYLRETLAGVGETVKHVATVTPYSYEPPAPSLQGLERLLAAALGGALMLDLRAPIRYGDEASYVPRLETQWNVLLMSLAATPETENHGVIIAAARDALLHARGGAPLAVIVDEAPYLARMGADPSLQQRVEERRKLWRSFVSGYGLKACLIDLSRAAGEVTERDREALRDALWTARNRMAVS